MNNYIIPSSANKKKINKNATNFRIMRLRIGCVHKLAAIRGRGWGWGRGRGQPGLSSLGNFYQAFYSLISPRPLLTTRWPAPSLNPLFRLPFALFWPTGAMRH